MKIAFIGQKGIPAKFGGVEKHVEQLSLGLVAKGHAVFVYTRPWYTASIRKSYRNVNLVSIKSLHTKHFDAITHTLFSTIHAMKNKFDVIHYHGVGPSLLSFLPRIFAPKIKIVTTFHCIDRLHQKWGSIARYMLKLGEWTSVKFAHSTITVSHCLTTYCDEKFNKETSYIPNGVNAHSEVEADLIKQKYGLEKDGYILFLSRLIRHKGVHHLINAYNKIVTDKKLVIAGGASFTTDYEREIKQLAKDNPNIIFIGNVEGESDLWKELFSNAYLFVHPSESEGLPIVLLEAMSFGRTVLASDIEENKEVIDGKYGLTFRNKSVIDLKEKIEYAIEYPNVVAKVGKDSIAHVEKNYNWGEIVENVEKVYEGLVEQVREQEINLGKCEMKVK